MIYHVRSGGCSLGTKWTPEILGTKFDGIILKLMKNQFQNKILRYFILIVVIILIYNIKMLFKSVHQIWMKFFNMIRLLSMVCETQIAKSARVRPFSGMIRSNMALCIGG